MAQERQGSRRPTSHLHRHRGSGWTKSGWQGWVYGWKLHLAITVAGMWIALSARLSPADVADNQIAPSLIEELPQEARIVLGDTHYNAHNVGHKCERTERILVTSKRGAYPHTDCGVEVRRIFHKLRRAMTGPQLDEEGKLEGYYVNTHFNFVGVKGVGQTTGEKYVVPATGAAVENFVQPGQIVTGTVDVNLIIGQGKLPDQGALVRVHYIIGPTGR